MTGIRLFDDPNVLFDDPLVGFDGDYTIVEVGGPSNKKKKKQTVKFTRTTIQVISQKAIPVHLSIPVVSQVEISTSSSHLAIGQKESNHQLAITLKSNILVTASQSLSLISQVTTLTQTSYIVKSNVSTRLQKNCHLVSRTSTQSSCEYSVKSQKMIGSIHRSQIYGKKSVSHKQHVHTSGLQDNKAIFLALMDM